MMAVLATAKMRKNYRMTLPKEVREILEVDVGDELVFFTMTGTKGRVCFRKSRS